MSAPYRSYQSPAFTPPDFWTRDPNIADLLNVLDDAEQACLAEMLEDLTTAWRFGGDYKTPAKELAEQLQRWHEQKQI